LVAPLDRRLIRWYAWSGDWSAHFYRATACNATHGIAKAFLSVCPTVCPFVTRVQCAKIRNLNVCPHSYTTRKTIHPSFLARRMVRGGDYL